MKRESLWTWMVLSAACVALALGGCAKKQVREETVAPSVSRAAPPALPAPPPVTEEELAPPPAQTAAVSPAPTPSPVPQGLAQPTSPGLERIHFDFDQYVLTPEAREVLARNAQYLMANPGVQIRIEGHCDERGTTEYNLALGERRAKSAFQYLMDLGVDPNRMSVVSYGEEVPLDPGHNEQAWALNRRAEFVEIRR
ncbi:MAG: peptidoglycan-associated lipoprotein Pal [Deferrisomatales bacterium]